MAANGTPQSQLYGSYGSMDNQYRDRSAEQNFTNSGNPMNYIPQYSDTYGSQNPNLGRYAPPMLDNQYSSGWQNGQGGYAYNLPTNFGPYQGSWGTPYSMQGMQGPGTQPQGQPGQPQGGGQTMPPVGYGRGGPPIPQIGQQQQSPQGGMPNMPYNPLGGPTSGMQGFGSMMQPPPITALQQAQTTAQFGPQGMQQNQAWQAARQAALARAGQPLQQSVGSTGSMGYVPNFNAGPGQSPFAAQIAAMRQQQPPPNTTQPILPPQQLTV